MDAALAIRKKDYPAKATASSGFKGFRPEEEKGVRSHEPIIDEKTRKIIQIWNEKGNAHNFNNFLSRVQSRLMHCAITAKDVVSFSLLLTGFQGEEGFSTTAGQFLNAMMRSSRDARFTIYTEHLEILPDHLGERNLKSITVHGDAGNYLGADMYGGSIHLLGSCGNFCGDTMRQGKIIVEGDCGLRAGHRMADGTIIVKGNAGDFLGERMTALDGRYPMITVRGRAGELVGHTMFGGEIRIGKGVGSISDDVPGGKIYVHGKLVAGK